MNGLSLTWRSSLGWNEFCLMETGEPQRPNIISQKKAGRMAAAPLAQFWQNSRVTCMAGLPPLDPGVRE
jgi:hypothetical protein